MIVAALVTGGAQAFGQGLTCVSNAGNPKIIRVEGLTETAGDLLLQCTGGTPTTAGQAIPVYTVTLSLNTNLTSRLLGQGYINALLLMDEPWPASPINPSPRPANSPYQATCFSSTTAAPGACNYLLGTGGGGYGSASNPYLQTHASTIYAGQQTRPNQVTWQGVPIDPPGQSGVRIIRLTNIRANAAQLGISSTSIPSQVVSFVSVDGVPQITVNNPQQTLGYIQSGMIEGVRPTIAPLCGCDSQNAALLTGGSVAAFDATINVKEGYAAGWQRRNVGLTADGATSPAVYDQNVPGFSYNTESDFMPTSSTVSPPNLPFTPVESGTKIRLTFLNVPLGVHIFVPVSVPLLLPGSNMGGSGAPGYPIGGPYISPQLRLVASDQNGVSSAGYTAIAGTAFVGSSAVAEATPSGTKPYAVYEVVNSDPSVVESASISFVAAFANVGPQSGTIGYQVSMAPISSVGTASAGPIPRFVSRTRVIGDFDANGVPDLVWQNNTTRQVTINYFGGDQGATLTSWNWLHPGSDAAGWHVAAVAAFFGDGAPDLVWVNDLTKQVTLHYYGGPGGASMTGWNWLYPSGVFGWHIVGAGDFDNNGVPDLVWQNDTTGQVTVNYLERGPNGVVVSGWNWLYPQAVVGWHAVAIADFNNDGVPDVVWMKDDTRQVTVNYFGGNRGAILTGWNWLNMMGGPGWRVVGALDFDNNGTPDLVWYNETTGQVTVNYYGGAGGANIIGWNWLYPVGIDGWTPIN